MAYFNKIGLLCFNEDQSKFLVCEKDNFTSDFIMPGGQIHDDESDEECLIREIKEELDVELDRTSLVFLKEYIGVAAGDSTKDVSIRLYQGTIIGEPKPSTEIIRLHWIGRNDGSNPRLSSIIKQSILPDLIAWNILREHLVL